ncbi:MAG: hypothetical protein KA736_08050 [Crocinitomicaceae bacterium]|nr:hypothetical protein [Crocinitomicaceae bacterium]MBP6032292.1 hypothetical protein [Crocinitomicaceae bacterium]
MKKNLLIITVLAGIGLSSCSKPGCTDIDATNYSEKAKTNDGSCTYSEKLIIWQSNSTSLLLQQAGISGISIYIDGSLAGSFLTTNYWTGTPSCDQTGNVSATIDMGNLSSKIVTLEYKDQDGTSLATENVLVTAGTCNTFEIQ